MNWILGIGGYIVNNAPALVGIILPPFVDILNKDLKSESERFWVTMLACLVVAAVLHWNELQYSDPAQIAMWVGIIFTESQVVYRLYFKNSIVREKLQNILPGTQPTEAQAVEVATP